ncbi:peptidylprolyl isomerase [Candidatus Peregrinibacteria bacterium CG_4_10_14_3_um_filter_44_21]|nr:MAG: peptidylprolyl isomerase [Candidatus Peregrinibacteria bacterium CG_4_10_14_3_um_filter_44_21]
MKKTLFVLLITIIMATSGCANATFDQFSGPQAGDTVVTMQTSEGDIKIRLFDELTPEMVTNFTTLAKEGYYDGLLFHRVIDGFMIQGGDPNGNGTGGHSYKGAGTKLDDEIAPGLTHSRGAISMANSGSDTNGSQFFIVQSDAAYLDGSYSLFGQVYDGMDVVDAIADVTTDGNDKPIVDVVIESVQIDTY